LLLTIDQGIAHLMINRPPSNSMTLEFFGQLSHYIGKIGNDPACRALIISGVGRHFSSGAQVEVLLNEIREEFPPFMLNHYNTFLAINKLNIPVIAAVRGVCLGSALELALACHFRLCSEDGLFGLPETSFNLMPGLGGIPMLASLTGNAAALELVLTARTFSAEEALKLKVVDYSCPKKELMGHVFRFAGQILPHYRKEKRPLYLKMIQNP
jgi:enoyl-CoA hydratase/carnithine racemase